MGPYIRSSLILRKAVSAYCDLGIFVSRQSFVHVCYCKRETDRSASLILLRRGSELGKNRRSVIYVALLSFRAFSIMVGRRNEMTSIFESSFSYREVAKQARSFKPRLRRKGTMQHTLCCFICIPARLGKQITTKNRRTCYEEPTDFAWHRVRFLRGATATRLTRTVNATGRNLSFCFLSIEFNL